MAGTAPVSQLDLSFGARAVADLLAFWLHSGCTTFQLSFPEECCPSSYTRVKSHRAGPGGPANGRERRAHALGVKRQGKAAPTLDPSTARHHAPSLPGKRRLDWLAPAHLLSHIIHPAQHPDSLASPPSPTRTASSTPHPEPNLARDAFYRPAPTAAPVTNPGQVALYAVDDGGCLLETAYRQATCPGPEDKAVEESRQVMRLEMFKQEARGRRVAIECGRVGTFWY